VAQRAKQERPVVEFVLTTLDAEDEEKVLRQDLFHATAPTEESLFLLAAAAGDEDGGVTSEAAAVLGVFRQALPEKEFRVLRERLKDPEDDVDIAMLQDVFAWLMEEWAGFPTVPSSDSPVSPPKTGTRSTGRAPGRGSTHST
jgi:hypothetical protein